MALRLLLMRHGKSDWTTTHWQRDQDRPLAPRGIKAAKQMGKWVRTSDQLPDLIVSSRALRARETADLFVQGARTPIPIQFSDGFYESTPERVLAAIRQRPEQVVSVMAVGHEPTWSELASQLMGGGALAFPTGAIARIDFEVNDWAKIHPGEGILKWLLQPKLLMQG